MAAKKTSTPREKLMKDIAAFANNLKSMHTALNQLCVLVLIHAIEHSDVVPGNKLLEVIDGRKTALRSNDLRSWFEQFGPFVWDAEKKIMAFAPEKRKKLAQELKEKGKAKFAGELKRQEFWMVKKETKYQGFNVESLLAAIVRKADKIKEGTAKVDPEKVDDTGIDQVRDLLSSIRMGRIEKQAS